MTSDPWCSLPITPSDSSHSTFPIHIQASLGCAVKFSHISGAQRVPSLLSIPRAALLTARLQEQLGINSLLSCIQRGEVSQLCSPGLAREEPGFHSTVGKPFLPQSCSEISRSCCNALLSLLRACPGHTQRGFPKGEGKGLQARQEFLDSWDSPARGSPGRQLSATRGKRAFAASPGAMEGIHCSCPNQASLPNKAETGEATGASDRFVCAGGIPTSIWPAKGTPSSQLLG